MKRLLVVLIALFATSCCCSSFSATTSSVSFLLGRRNRNPSGPSEANSQREQQVPSRSDLHAGLQPQTDEDSTADDIVHQFGSQSTRHAAALLFHCALVGAGLPLLVIRSGNLFLPPLVGAIVSVVLASVQTNPYGEWIRAVGMVLLSCAWQRYPAIRQQYPTMRYIRQGIVFTRRRNRLPPLRSGSGGSTAVVAVGLLALLGGGLGHALVQPVLALSLLEVPPAVVPQFVVKSGGFLLGAILVALAAVLFPGDMGDALYSMGLRAHAMLGAAWELMVRETHLVSKTGAMVGHLIGTILWVVDRERRLATNMVAGTDWLQHKLLLQQKKKEPTETSKGRRRRRPRANVPIVTEYVDDDNVPPPPSIAEARPPPPKSAPPPPPPGDDEDSRPPPENPGYIPQSTPVQPLWMRPNDYPQVPVEEAGEEQKKGPFNGFFRRRRVKSDDETFEGWEFGSDPATSDDKDKKRR